MIEDATLLDKREELKRQLATGEYRTLVDVVLDSTGRLIQKLTRSRKPASYWVSAVILVLITLLIGLLISLVSGELDPARQEGILLGLIVVIVIATLASMVLAKHAQGILLSTLRDHLVDAIEAEADLDELHRWLVGRYNMRKQLFFCVALTALMSSYTTAMGLAIGGEFIGLGVTFLGAIAYFLGGTLIYLYFLVVVFCARLSSYQLKLHAANPGSSEIIDHLSGMIGHEAFIGAVLSASLSVGYALLGQLSLPVVIALVATGWGPTIIVFVTGQRALTKIIARRKWKTLGGIQARIDALAAQENIADGATTDALNRLMDLHDRIRATRSSAMDLRAGLAFLNSLLLPLIAFLLANLDRVLELFR